MAGTVLVRHQEKQLKEANPTESGSLQVAFLCDLIHKLSLQRIANQLRSSFQPCLF
jgi:hypothetical protein